MEIVVENCGYNPDRDIQPVSQDGFIDLKAAFAEGFVPGEASPTDTEFDGNEEPESIIGRPANTFEAIHMVESLKAAKAAKDVETNG